MENAGVGLVSVRLTLLLRLPPSDDLSADDVTVMMSSVHLVDGAADTDLCSAAVVAVGTGTRGAAVVFANKYGGRVFVWCLVGAMTKEDEVGVSTVAAESSVE